ncbi:MAG: Asp-tRNA(Asn)/Glu-tRNA(Gln) amidotransferase subunit GatC [Spirochaetales bacterium]|nr:MAG: Asp-tRNA(Asn)/Glu-tRNA(Gln) amidotransferase subunit GatC [Spirochaetales bacterium]
MRSPRQGEIPMIIDEKQILRVAELARLELTEQEKKEYSRQLSDILAYVEKISEMDTVNVLPTDHIVELYNVFRDDLVREHDGASALRSMAPRFEEGHVVVPIIIEGQE